MSDNREVVSHHLFRRTARARREKFEASERSFCAQLDAPLRFDYKVEKASRGPWRWWVVAIRR